MRGAVTFISLASLSLSLSLSFLLSLSLSSFRLPRILLFLGIIAIFSRAESAFPGSTWRKIWPSNRCNFQNSFQLCYKKSKISSHPSFPFFSPSPSLSLFPRHFSELTWTGTESQVARHKVNRVPLVHCNSSTTWDCFYPPPPLSSLLFFLYSLLLCLYWDIDTVHLFHFSRTYTHTSSLVSSALLDARRMIHSLSLSSCCDE